MRLVCGDGARDGADDAAVRGIVFALIFVLIVVADFFGGALSDHANTAWGDEVDAADVAGDVGEFFDVFDGFRGQDGEDGLGVFTAFAGIGDLSVFGDGWGSSDGDGDIALHAGALGDHGCHFGSDSECGLDDLLFQGFVCFGSFDGGADDFAGASLTDDEGVLDDHEGFGGVTGNGFANIVGDVVALGCSLGKEGGAEESQRHQQAW